jgi:hypothetical protein
MFASSLLCCLPHPPPACSFLKIIMRHQRGCRTQKPGNGTSISGDSPDISAASSLTDLGLVNNGLSGTLTLPPTLKAFILRGTAIARLAVPSNNSLEQVSVSRSPLEGSVPRELLEGPALKQLYIEDTRFSSLPSGWESKTLELLHLRHNNFSVCSLPTVPVPASPWICLTRIQLTTSTALPPS